MPLRTHMVISALMIVSLGLSALAVLDKTPAIAFFQGAITLGGALLICFLFSFRMPWHAYIATAILSILSLSRGLPNLAHLADLSTPLPLFELAITLVIIPLPIHVFVSWKRHRMNSSLDSLK